MTGATYERSAAAHTMGPSRVELEEENRQLREGLASRALVGQAVGVVMIRLGVDAEVALAYLRRRSSHENRKLVGIARDVAESRGTDLVAGAAACL
ncbi:hypothetical protein GCM10023339_34600 [Alloalcanivorax gelatiniphagus]